MMWLLPAVALPACLPLFSPGGAAAPLRQLEGQRKTPIEAQMEDLALRKPDDVAQLLRGWLLERR